jgi:hypothetical protein
VGGSSRRSLSQVTTLAELRGVLAGLDPTLTMCPGAMRQARSHHGGPKPVALPDGWLRDPDAVVRLSEGAERPGSGG